MRARFFLLAVGACLTFSAFSQEKRESTGTDGGKVTYVETNGRLDGVYTSFYTNGAKKAEGRFRNNQRFGEWTVFDSTGTKVMQRTYRNLFEYDQLYPDPAPDKTARLLKGTGYDLTRNEKGLIPWFDVKESMVVWSKRLWQNIPASENPVLFDNNRLFSVLYGRLASGELKLYEDKWVVSDKRIDTAGLRCVAFRIMEDNFFDNERLISETRILALEPVLVNAANDTVPFGGRFYFPQVRQFLAQESAALSGNPAVQTLDDVFFFRDFAAQVYKESSFLEREDNAGLSGPDVENEAKRIAIGLIEQEHDLWLEFWTE